MDLWVGPAIVAALVSAIVSVIGWVVTFRMSLRMEQMRRDEKVHDVQVALRAEIESDLLILAVADRSEFLEEVRARYEADLNYSPVVPNLSRNVVFDAVVKDIQILPGDAIAPVIHYARMRQTVDQFVADLRAPIFTQLSAERQLAMYADYLDMLGRLEEIARTAVLALNDSLNSSDVARSIPKSASGAGKASASGSALP